MNFFAIVTKFRIVHPCSQQIRHSYQQICDKNTVYFRHLNAKKIFEIHFWYKNLEFGIDRSFYFNRREDEKIGIFLENIRRRLQTEFLMNSVLLGYEKKEQPTVRDMSSNILHTITSFPL